MSSGPSIVWVNMSLFHVSGTAQRSFREGGKGMRELLAAVGIRQQPGVGVGCPPRTGEGVCSPGADDSHALVM
jgi:hypothetical protein